MDKLFGFIDFFKANAPLGRFIADNRIRFVKAFTVELCANICIVALTFSLAQCVAGVIGFQSFKARVLGLSKVETRVWLWIFFGLALLRLLLDLSRFRIRAALSEDFAFNLRVLLFSRYINQEDKSSVRIGVALLRFSGDMGAARQLLSAGILQATADMVLVMTGLLLVWILNPGLGLAFVATLVICYVGISLVFTRLPQKLRLSHNTQASLLAYVSDALSGIDSLRAFNRESRACRQFERKAGKVRDANHRLQATNGGIRASAQFMSYSLIAVLLFVGKYGALAPDVLFFCVLIALNWRVPLSRLFRVGSIWQKGLVALSKFSNDTSIPTPTSLAQISPNEHFRLEISAPLLGLQPFSITNSEFKQISISFENYKTRMLRALAGIITAQDIEIRWNDRPAAHYSPRQLRRIVVFVSDVFPLTGLTLLDALRLGTNAEANCVAIERLAIWQGMFPPLSGLNPLMRMRDLRNELSLTQQILLQFVRADIANRPMVVIDDPFAFLDDITSHRLRSFLNEIWADRAILYLSQNKSWEWGKDTRNTTSTCQ